MASNQTNGDIVWEKQEGTVVGDDKRQLRQSSDVNNKAGGSLVLVAVWEKWWLRMHTYICSRVQRSETYMIGSWF